MRTPLIMLGAVVLVAAVVVALSSVGSGVAPTPSEPSSAAASTASGAAASPAGPPKLLWPAPPDPLDRAVAAGLEPAPKEYKVNHVHAHLDVFIEGEEILVPAGIGINIKDPEVKFFDYVGSYAGIEMCDQPCISPLHTHDASGILHTESMDPEPHTLGQFFTEWGVELSETCVGEHCSPTPIAVYIGGEPYVGDPRAIELTDLKVIVIVVGTPPAVIPSTADFSNA
ncbi:MAG TPA: hypothetical protein VGQ89_05005 [Candidatus Limnocylindrales bacterium]|jgi:hypothetical protein|nr:hypothetical protein [Candidatus Limnocylindrales bacterium]